MESIQKNQINNISIETEIKEESSQQQKDHQEQDQKLINQQKQEQQKSEKPEQHVEELKQSQINQNPINENQDKKLTISQLKINLKNCFSCEDITQFENEFKNLKHTIESLNLQPKSDQQEQDVLYDAQFFQKLLFLSQINNPLKCKRVIELYTLTLGDQDILEQLCKLNEKQRLIVDLLNSFFVLIEKFQNTYLEWNLKLLFSEINENLAHHDFFHELLSKISQQGGKILEGFKLNSEQDELVLKILNLSQMNEMNKKNEAITSVSLLLGKCQNIEEQFYMFCSILTPAFKHLVKVPQNVNDQIKVSFYNAILDIFERYIFPTEYYIEIDTINVHSTRTYQIKNEKAYLMNHVQIYYSLATILNEVLLFPSEIQLQNRAFILIRRMYFLFQKERKLLDGPIKVVLENIALYSKEISQEKEATIFLYKLLQDEKTRQELKDKLNESQYINKLKENKYFSIKALSYPNDLDIIYKFKNLNLQIMFPYYKKIEAGAYFHYNFIVQKPNTIIYWNFKTIDYDISFGLYRIEVLSEILINDYIQEKDVKSVIKLQRSDSYKQPITGLTFISQPGYYRILFDNSYSFWRAKELYYSIHVLEP